MLTRNLPTLFNDNFERLPRFSNWLDSVFDEVLNERGTPFSPEMDVMETDKTFEISVSIPGIKKKDVNIEIENNVLSISGEKKQKREENNNRYRRVESRYGRFYRLLPLPDNIDSEKIDAEYKDGLLNITVPKTKESAGRKIKVS